MYKKLTEITDYTPSSRNFLNNPTFDGKKYISYHPYSH